MEGRSLPLTAPRRLIIDLMKVSMPVPRVTVQRRMNLEPLLEARYAGRRRPSWLAMFIKGYGLLARETPEFRRAYVKLPWPRLFEYPMSVASIAHEREIDGEKAVLLTRLKAPEHCPIQEIDRLIQLARELPVDEVPEFRKALRFASVPAFLRRLAMRAGLNLARQRANYFGTFSVSVYSSLGAESFNPLSPLTTHLNYGPIDEAGAVNVRILYDHRVTDGAVVARALRRFEEILNDAVAAEVLVMQGSRATARRRSRRERGRTAV